MEEADELRVQRARDEQQHAVYEDGHEVGQRQILVQMAYFQGGRAEDAALIEHGAVNPGLVQPVAERDEAQLAERGLFAEVDADGDARYVKAHDPPWRRFPCCLFSSS